MKVKRYMIIFLGCLYAIFSYPTVILTERIK